MQAVLDQILAIVIQGSVALILPAIVALIVQAARKYGFQIGAEQQARLQVIAENAVLAAEEWAADRIKQQVPTSGFKKFERAADILLSKVPGISDEEAHDLIHAALPKIGLGATDFLSKVRAAQKQ